MAVQRAGAPDGDADCWSCLCRARRKSAAGSSSWPMATPGSSNQRDSVGVRRPHRRLCVAIAPRSLRLLDQQGDLPRDDLSVGVTLDAH